MISQTLISRGKDVDEAIQNGLNILSKTIEEVDIEILDNGKKGILLVGGKDAKVKLTVSEKKDSILTNDSPPTSTDYESLIDEAVVDWSVNDSEEVSVNHDHPLMEPDDHLIVIRDGKVTILEGDQHYATIKPGVGVKLFKNGEQFLTSTIFTEKDELTYELDKETHSMEWNVTFDDDYLSVVCHITPEKVKEYHLVDQEAERFLEIHGSPTETIQNHLEPNALISKLDQLKVVHGINHANIRQACQTLKEERIVIAEGTKPQPGENGKVDFNIDIVSQKGKPKINEDGTVDFRETAYIPSVDQGEVLGTIVEPIPGKPGKTVLGELIPPAKSFPANIKAGKGVEVIDDQIVAAESGKPQIQTRGSLYKIQILPTLTHPGDVNIETGNITFTGDVEVHGNVEEEMKVDAIGNVKIAGRVDHADIKSGNGIYISQNVINSELTAGRSNLLISNLGRILEELSEYIHKIIHAIQQIIRARAFKSSDFDQKGILPLLNILLEKKFKGAKPLMKNYVDKVEENKELLEDEWLTLANYLKEIVQFVSSDTFSEPRDLNNLRDLIEQLRAISHMPPEPNSKIIIPYAMNSKIYCSGDIEVIRNGSYHTEFYSGGSITIKGALIGGEAFAQSNIYIEETGSKSGQATLVSVPFNQEIKIDYAWQDTILQIGNLRRQLHQDYRWVRAIVLDGEIVLN
ncbi:flagellar assembly protein A [Alkalibacillus aidingensis]|uniref:flagellar assembly protein A n=1 Tax=Alkalibacillus aidingensis TaxID=2747607 RepID=UPI0016606D0A|nr:flagellar assembly protein A [Alkalibacillus aidingensis]